MHESILTSIKKLLGMTEDYTAFDTDIVIHINTVLFILYQIGVGTEPFVIHGDAEKWEDFIGSEHDLELIKTYVYAKVRMIFDPPLSSAVAEAMNRTINELEFRINVKVDPGKEKP